MNENIFEDDMFNLVEAAEFLLDNGADTEIMDVNRQTALHYAAKSGSVVVAAVLLARGANLEARDKEGKTALHYARSDNETPVMVIELLTHGVDVNAKDNMGFTPLHLAFQHGNGEQIEHLLEAGADWEAMCEEGRTPLEMSTRDEIVQSARPIIDRTIVIIEIIHYVFNWIFRFASVRGIYSIERDLPIWLTVANAAADVRRFMSSRSDPTV